MSEIIWHERYRKIDSPEAKEFLRIGLDYAIELLGEPKTAIKEIYLCRSQIRDPLVHTGKTGFQLTEIVNESTGEFAIYLSHDPSSHKFYGQLAHEIAHLLNARLYDVYVEGLNTVFAEKLLRKQKMDWTALAEYFRGGNEPFYGKSYEMLRLIDSSVRNSDMKRLLSYAEEQSPGSPRMAIDIDGWIRSLPPKKQKIVINTIEKYKADIQSALQSSPGHEDDYQFQLPARH
jgi:hypothetical protein